MDNTYDVTIKFIDGEVMEITGATNFGINGTDNSRYAYVEKSNYKQFFNYPAIKYIGRSLDLKQEG